VGSLFKPDFLKKNAAIPNSKKMTVQPKNGQWYRLVMQYKTVPAAI
jgi:hypothetical protein